MGGNPSAQLPRALLCLHRAISRASPKSSRQAPSRPGWRGKLERGGRPRLGRWRGDARGGAGKWCESGNQTWASCTASSRMGLWTASYGQPITPLEMGWVAVRSRDGVARRVGGRGRRLGGLVGVEARVCGLLFI
jgi:hypothetical protein